MRVVSLLAAAIVLVNLKSVCQADAANSRQPVTQSSGEPFLPVSAVVDLSGASSPPSVDETLRVAAVQMANFNDGQLRSASEEIVAKTAKVVQYIQKSSALGAEIAVFPEMVLVRYDADLIANGTAQDITTAENAIAAACRAAKIWAIVGLPKYLPLEANMTQATCNAMSRESRWWNTALVFDDNGRKVYRQAKLRCGGPDGQLGQWLNTFVGPKNVTSSLQICADAGDPNIVRLPAMKGARIIYDISAESGLEYISKLAPYEAQYVALTLLANGVFGCEITPVFSASLFYQSIPVNHSLHPFISSCDTHSRSAHSTIASGSRYMARAHESHSFLVQANMASTWDARGNILDAQGGSHGNSLVVAPDGNLLARAPSFGEYIVLQDLDLRLAPPEPGYMPHAFMQPFYDAGAKLLSSMPVD